MSIGKTTFCAEERVTRGEREGGGSRDVVSLHRGRTISSSMSLARHPFPRWDFSPTRVFTGSSKRERVNGGGIGV